MQVMLTLTDIEDVKKDLGLTLPEVKSSHRVEALARGLGWATNAALRVDLTNAPTKRKIRVEPFVEYLVAHGFQTDGGAFVRAVLRVAIRAVMKAQPVLTSFGFGVYDEHRLDVEERKRR